MRKYLRISLSVLLLIAVLVGCDIHEYPVIRIYTPLVLHLDFDTVIPFYQEVTYAKTPQRISKQNLPNDYDIRHIVSIHRLKNDGSYNRTPDTLITYICPTTDSLNCTRVINDILEGEYKLFVWTDYVPKGQDCDLFYNTSNFEEIILNGKDNYTGNCQYREAFRGEKIVTIRTQHDGTTSRSVTDTIQMQRPLAKFQVISTDYKVFIEKALETARLNLPSSGSAEEDTEYKTVDPNDYTVLFRYAEFLPCSYNIFTDHPADSWTGIYFTGNMTPISDTDIQMGYDYVFVNGAEAAVAIIVEVYNKDNVCISASPTINIPLKRNHTTIVKGDFLTSTAQGGILINTDFNGDYNIEIK